MVNIWYQNATNYCNKWFKGSGKQPVTWETLVQTLHDSELSTVKKNLHFIGKCSTFSNRHHHFNVIFSDWYPNK